MFRYVDKPDLQNKMSRLAREELRHFEQVLAIIRRREIELRNVGSSRYAAGLRELVRNHEPYRLTDTLVIGALSRRAPVSASPCSCRTWTRSWASSITGCSSRKRGTSRITSGWLICMATPPMWTPPSFGCASGKELIESPDSEFRFHSGVPAAA